MSDQCEYHTSLNTGAQLSFNIGDRNSRKTSPSGDTFPRPIKQHGPDIGVKIPQRILFKKLETNCSKC